MKLKPNLSPLRDVVIVFAIVYLASVASNLYQTYKPGPESLPPPSAQEVLEEHQVSGYKPLPVIP